MSCKHHAKFWWNASEARPRTSGVRGRRRLELCGPCALLFGHVGRGEESGTTIADLPYCPASAHPSMALTHPLWRSPSGPPLSGLATCSREVVPALSCPVMDMARFARDAIKDDTWDFGNKFLYDLCRDYPDHSRRDEIVAKVWLIGRSYAAPIERGRQTERMPSSEEFYEKVLAPAFVKGHVDRWFDEVRRSQGRDRAVLLGVHAQLTDLFKSISGQSKRSLAAKYLHFHFPDYYFMFDSRAEHAVRSLPGLPRRHSSEPANLPDHVYRGFFMRCHFAQGWLTELLGAQVGPRDVDKVLLAWDHEYADGRGGRKP
jgi:hypothetical protein